MEKEKNIVLGVMDEAVQEQENATEQTDATESNESKPEQKAERRGEPVQLTFAFL